MAATAHALHILVKHKEIAEDIIKQLGKGAKFQISDISQPLPKLCLFAGFILLFGDGKKLT